MDCRGVGEVRLLDWAARFRPNELIAVGGQTAFIYIGKKEFLYLYLELTRQKKLLYEPVVEAYRQEGSEGAYIGILGIETGSAKGLFWLSTECYEHMIKLLRKKIEKKAARK